MTTMQKIPLVVIFLLGINSLFAQGSTSTTPTNTFPINNSLTSQQKIDAVYGPTFFSNKPQLLQQFLHLLDNRIAYKTQPRKQGEKYRKISEMPKMAKYASAPTQLQTQFAPDTFNPLRYKLSFFSNLTQFYRIDNTDYILIIKPQ